MSDVKQGIVEKLAEFFVENVLAVKALHPDLDVKSAKGYQVLIDFLRSKVQDKKKITMILPAFPSKSCNLDKVLGTAADFSDQAEKIYQQMLEVDDLLIRGSSNHKQCSYWLHHNR